VLEERGIDLAVLDDGEAPAPDLAALGISPRHDRGTPARLSGRASDLTLCLKVGQNVGQEARISSSRRIAIEGDSTGECALADRRVAVREG
jgi:hypothetical protein